MRCHLSLVDSSIVLSELRRTARLPLHASYHRSGDRWWGITTLFTDAGGRCTATNGNSQFEPPLGGASRFSKGSGGGSLSRQRLPSIGRGRSRLLGVGLRQAGPFVTDQLCYVLERLPSGLSIGHRGESARPRSAETAATMTSAF